MDVAVLGKSQGSHLLQTMAKECGHKVKYVVDDFCEGAMKPQELPSGFPLIVGLFDNRLRLELGKKFNTITLVHPSAYVAPTAKIGKGTIVKQRACIGDNVVIGENCIIDSGVIIEHDSFIGNGAQLTVGTVTGGFVKIDERTLVGLNCILQTKVNIGKDCIICSGAVVFSDVPDKTKIRSGVWIKDRISYDVK